MANIFDDFDLDIQKISAGNGVATPFAERETNEMTITETNKCDPGCGGGISDSPLCDATGPLTASKICPY